jgi:hypothetical protein
MTSATVSRLHVAMYPTIRGFEDPMLETIARCYYDQHSPIIRPDDVQPAEIVERRVHVGVHNGLGFIGTVFSTTLEPVLDDEIGDGFELEFNGHLELANLCVDEPGLAVVFVLEYKVASETCESKALNESTDLAWSRSKTQVLNETYAWDGASGLRQMDSGIQC